MLAHIFSTLFTLAIKAIGQRGAKKLVLKSAEVVKDYTENDFDDKAYVGLKFLLGESTDEEAEEAKRIKRDEARKERNAAKRARRKAAKRSNKASHKAK